MNAAERRAHSEKVQERRRQMRERRARTAAEFRAKLLAELNCADESTLPASRLALVDSACSAHLMIAESTWCYLNGHTSRDRERRWGLARSELRRALRCLGLIERDDEPENEPETIDQILADAGVTHGRA